MLSLTASNLVLALVVLPGMVASLVLGSTGTSTILALSNPHLSISQHRNRTTQHNDDNSTTTNGSESVEDFISTTTGVGAETESLITNIVRDQEKQQQGDVIIKSMGIHEREKVHDGYQSLDDVTTKTEGLWREEEEDGARDTESGQIVVDGHEVEEVQGGDKEEEAHPIHQGERGGGWKGGGQWAGSHKLCQGAAFFTNFVTSASAITVAVIALDRLVSFRHFLCIISNIQKY